MKHINEISASLGGRITTLAGRPDWDCGERELEKIKTALGERGSDTVFHFVASRRVMTHCVPLPSIRLLGHTHMHVHMPAMCEIDRRTYSGPFVFRRSECGGAETPDRPPCHRLPH